MSLWFPFERFFSQPGLPLGILQFGTTDKRLAPKWSIEMVKQSVKIIKKSAQITVTNLKNSDLPWYVDADGVRTFNSPEKLQNKSRTVSNKSTCFEGLGKGEAKNVFFILGWMTRPGGGGDFLS